MLEGAFNFRDLGGLPLPDGRRIRAGRLFRSDTLQALTTADVRRLLDDIGLRNVVDLRLAEEVEREGRGPLAATGRVTYVDSPFEMAPTAGVAPDRILERLYESCLASDSLPRAVRGIAAAAGQPTLFHCAAGKDRTGIVAATVLGLVGVGDDAIVADYMRSAAAMPRIVERFRHWPRYRDHMAATPPQAYAVEESAIRHWLAIVRGNWGGWRGWATRQGITEQTFRRLEGDLIEDGGD